MAKDVLEVLDIAGRSLVGAGASEFREDFTEARARIAELIAADVEYDAAEGDYRNDRIWCELSDKEFRPIAERYRAAKERRAAALAACRGLA